MKIMDEVESFVRNHRELWNFRELITYCAMYGKTEWYRTIASHSGYFYGLIDSLKNGYEITEIEKKKYLEMDLMFENRRRAYGY